MMPRTCSFSHTYIDLLAKLREFLMQTHRFGRKIKLPATRAIKHQIRMLMAQYEVKKAGVAEARAEEFHEQPSPAVLSAVPGTEINANAVARRIRQL
jgi:hypothetical protein